MHYYLAVRYNMKDRIFDIQHIIFDIMENADNCCVFNWPK